MKTKKCRSCCEVKTVENFFRESLNKTDGRAGTCKACKTAKTLIWREENRDKYNQGAKDWRAKNIAKDRVYNSKRHLRTLYGITYETYLSMLESQEHKCAICSGSEGRNRRGIRMKLCVDHCHKTGKVRQLLCSDCNAALGYLKDSPEFTTRATEYLLKHQAKTPAHQ